jgi:hypothetical protein
MVNERKTQLVYASRTPATLQHPAGSSIVRRRTTPLAVGANLAMLLGGAAVAWSAAIHLHLWKSGYRTISTIGPLFLFQSVSGFVLAVLIASLRRVAPALIGAGFLAATIGGLVLSVKVGLFGFRDSFGAPFAGLSMVVESAGIIVLLCACALRIATVRRRSTSKGLDRRHSE